MHVAESFIHATFFFYFDSMNLFCFSAEIEAIYKSHRWRKPADTNDRDHRVVNTIDLVMLAAQPWQNCNRGASRSIQLDLHTHARIKMSHRIAFLADRMIWIFDKIKDSADDCFFGTETRFRVQLRAHGVSIIYYCLSFHFSDEISREH